MCAARGKGPAWTWPRNNQDGWLWLNTINFTNPITEH